MSYRSCDKKYCAQNLFMSTSASSRIGCVRCKTTNKPLTGVHTHTQKLMHKLTVYCRAQQVTQKNTFISYSKLNAMLS